MIKNILVLTTALYVQAVAHADSASSIVLTQADGLTLQWQKLPTSPEVIDTITEALRNQQAQSKWDERLEIDWQVIQNLGKKVWTVISDNAPVANLQYDYATGLPQGVTSAAELNSFSDLNFETWAFKTTNMLGNALVNVEYTLVHQYGGSYQGRGKYLATVAIIPSKVDVSWGYKLDMKAVTVSSVNVGTAEEPVASVTLEMSYEIRDFMQTIARRKLFQFRGDSAEIVSTTP